MDGYDLTALIFAREVSGPLTSLVKTIDKQLAEVSARHKRADKFGVFVVFCNDDAGMNQQLKDLSAKEKLKHVVLCTTRSSGPPRYQVAKEADLTVVVYANSEDVTANFPLKRGELNEDRSRAIIKALTQVLPKK